MLSVELAVSSSEHLGSVGKPSVALLPSSLCSAVTAGGVCEVAVGGGTLGDSAMIRLWGKVFRSDGVTLKQRQSRKLGSVSRKLSGGRLPEIP